MARNGHRVETPHGEFIFFIVSGSHDCLCCGIHVSGQNMCDSCADEKCDPAETWHCFTGHCDGSGCSFPGECEGFTSTM